LRHRNPPYAAKRAARRFVPKKMREVRKARARGAYRAAIAVVPPAAPPEALA